jgi:hypothetical protein
MLGDTAFHGFYDHDNYVFIVGADGLPAGERFVALSLPGGRLQPLQDRISFSGGGDSVGVSAVTPASVSSSKDAFVVLQGRGFSKALSLQLANGVIIRNASFTSLTDRVMMVRIPKGIASGNYAINVMDVSGIHTPKRAVVTITP